MYIIKSKAIDLPSVGLILLEKSSRAKHIILSIKPPKKIRVAIPIGTSFSDAESFVKTKVGWIQNQLSKVSNVIDTRIELKQIDRNIARPKLEGRIEELAQKYQFTFNKLSIKIQKTSWGSCSLKNKIKLNARLLHLPTELIDYVILHELVHTRVKNHSKEFWSTLDRFVGDSKFYDKQLRSYKII
jgi:predicted metal-dependent hydrolase